jgi:hypothetical protein
LHSRDTGAHVVYVPNVVAWYVFCPRTADAGRRRAMDVLGRRTDSLMVDVFVAVAMPSALLMIKGAWAPCMTEAQGPVVRFWDAQNALTVRENEVVGFGEVLKVVRRMGRTDL